MWEKREIVSRRVIKTHFDLFDYCEKINNDQDIYLYAKLNSYYYKPRKYSRGFDDVQRFNFGIVDKDGCFKASHDIYSKGYHEHDDLAEL